MASTAEKRLLAVVPLYNEEHGVDRLLDRLGAVEGVALAGVVLVDDGSTDQTVSRIEARMADFPAPMRLIRLSRNFGHQSALMAGCEAACGWADELGAQWIGVIDGDLQDRPEHFADLMAATDGQDVVYAVREVRRDGLIMKTCAPLFYRLLSKSAHFPIPENAGAFSVIRLPVCRVIVESSDSEPYFPGLRAWAGFRQKGIPLTRDARAVGDSKVALSGLLKLSFRAIMLYSDLPLRLIFTFGLTLGVIIAIVSFGVAALRLMGKIDPTGVTTIIILQLASTSLLIVFIGIVAFMVNRVKSNTSRQKPWVVMERRDR